ncbi:MAG TPA: SUMF1/EgtB/PvdO family nonheme iron enzyme [Planctomycetota bacterium]|nr:SUMF1/EgtB/PvdO family nonheme iron enzyme [Planctomycetota bacterium]
MTVESSRKTESQEPYGPGGCPRCGTRLRQPYKYCPNCAYRLRPDLFPAPATEVRGVPVSQRLVALGGYLLFAGMLLLVAFAGVRLFSGPEPLEPVQPQVRHARDGNCLALTLDEFVEVPAGYAFWGAYDPAREYAPAVRPEAADEERDAADRALRALATLRSDTTKPKEIEGARQSLREALRDLPIRDAIERWADSSGVEAPQEPVEAIPDAYRVDDPFRMSKREVTNDQYFEFLRDWAKKSGKPVHRHLIPGGWTRRTGRRDVDRIYKDGEGNLPVVNISIDAALEFCGWFWEEKLGADPDLVVDLPTWREYVLAARGDNLTYNYPWGPSLRQGETVNLGTSGLWSVVENRRSEEFYNGFLDLVGNAAEWVYAPSDLIVAAGWSYQDEWVYRVGRGEAGQPGRLATPFSINGFKIVRGPPRDEGPVDVGFRPVIRRAPSLPAFVAVTKGPVRHRPCPEDILPPERLGAEEADESDGPETIERIKRRREPLVSFASETDRVERDFEISATEVTNRQYLAFIGDIAARYTKDEIVAQLLPRGWHRKNLLVRFEDQDQERPFSRAYDGYYVPWEKLDILYAPGQENAPVEGVTIEQGDAYMAWLSGKLGRRCAVPTVAQYLRAGRGDGASPYPWGDDENDVELLPSCRQEPSPLFSRAFALTPSAARPIVGLAGNIAEFVRDPEVDGRVLLAGGFFDLPPRLVTLDCFLDADWDSIQYVLEPGDWDWPLEDEREASDVRPLLSSFFTISHYAGLRVVRYPDPF